MDCTLFAPGTAVPGGSPSVLPDGNLVVVQLPRVAVLTPVARSAELLELCDHDLVGPVLDRFDHVTCCRPADDDLPLAVEEDLDVLAELVPESSQAGVALALGHTAQVDHHLGAIGPRPRRGTDVLLHTAW